MSLDEDTAELAAELEQGEAETQAAKYIPPQSVPTRFSLLKLMAQSPAHYRAACQRPQDDSLAARLGSAANARERKDALRFGTAVHAMLFGEKVAVYTGGRRDMRIKAYKDFLAQSSAEGCVEVITPAENVRAKSIADAIKRNPDASRLLFDGTTVEQRIDWTFCGKPTRSTPDAYTKAHSADLKTAMTADPLQFQRAGLRLFYHCQGALYADAIEEQTGTRPADVYVIGVEKSDPFPVSVLRVTERALEIGAKLNRQWIERLVACEAMDEWPEYLQSIGEFDVDMPQGVELEFNGRTLTV